MKNVIASLTDEQTQSLKEAVHKIAEARDTFDELNKQMKQAKKWTGQGDIAAIAYSINELCDPVAGGIGCFLEYFDNGEK